MKKIIIFIFSVSIFSHYSPALGDDTDTILGKANECLVAEGSKASGISNPFKKDGIYLACKIPSGCAGENQCKLSQVLLDLLFSKIDADVEKYIDSLSSGKSDITIIEKISKKFSSDGGDKISFANRYNEVCSNGPNSVFTYMGKYKDKYGLTWTTNNPLPFDYIKCENLYLTKLKAYQNTANSKIQRNSVNTHTADKKTFMTKIKDNFEKLLNQFDKYIAKFGIIKDQWTVATPKAQK